MVHRIHQDSETTVNTENQNRELEERMMYLRYWPKPIVELLMKYYVKNQKANE